MAVTRTSFLFGILVFLCLSLSSANRVLKDGDAKKESISNSASSGHNDQLENFSHADLNNSNMLKGSIPKYGPVGPTSSDCCNFDHCGENVCPPSYSCGGNSGCPSYHNCPWQGCQGYQGGCQVYQGCQGCQGGCQGYQGCQACQPPPCDYKVGVESSKVEESIRIAEPDLVPPSSFQQVQPGNPNIKSSGGANQETKSNGGSV